MRRVERARRPVFTGRRKFWGSVNGVGAYATRELAKPQLSGAKEENSQKAESFRLTEASRLMEGWRGS